MEPGLDVLISQMTSDDSLSVLLKGHLWIEAMVEASLRSAVSAPEALGTRMQFSEKLRWAKALGSIDSEYLEFVTTLNAIRNRAAHRLTFELKADDVSGLVAKLPRHLAPLHGVFLRSLGEPGNSTIHSLQLALLLVTTSLRHRVGSEEQGREIRERWPEIAEVIERQRAD
jgi:hypothetical protein